MRGMRLEQLISGLMDHSLIRQTGGCPRLEPVLLEARDHRSRRGATLQDGLAGVVVVRVPATTAAVAWQSVDLGYARTPYTHCSKTAATVQAASMEKIGRAHV